MDKAKGFIKDHEAQIQSATDKAKQAVNNASNSMNQRVSGRLPDTGTSTPYGQPVQADDLEDEATADAGDEATAAPTTLRAPTDQAGQRPVPPPPPGPPLPG
jgi:hypothetical protein